LTLSDSATLSGGYFPTGAIVFTLTGPGGFVFTETNAVAGNGTYTASTLLPTAGIEAGTYVWAVDYLGDGNNNAIGASLEPISVGGVPEPSTWVMMAVGFAGLGFAGFRRSDRQDVSTVSA
jgi:hypothetical protein